MDNSTEIVAGAIIVAAVMCIALYVWMATALGAVFAKLGEPRWKAWMPIVNSIAIYRLGGYSALWVIAQLLPVANIVAAVIMILALLNINRRFGRGAGFTVLAFLALPIWASILGFGQSRVLDPVDKREESEEAPVFVPSRPPVTWAGPPVRSGDRQASSVSVSVSSSASVSSAPMSSAPAPSSVEPVIPVETVVFLEPEAVVARPVATATPEEFSFDFTPTPPPASHAALAPAHAPVEVEVAPAVPPGSAAPPVPIEVPAASPIAQSLWAQPPAALPSPIWTDRRDSAIVDGATVITGRAPLFDEDENEFDVTVISARRVQPWVFETDEGQRVALTHPVVLVGRNPSRGRTHPDAQLVEVTDPGKTVSKTHARIELVDGSWIITDLHSTNGVFLKADGGFENELNPGASGALTGDFLLGELSARIYQER